MCPKCNDHVFARNDNCRRCGQSRPTGADLAAMAAAGTLPPVNSATSLAPRQSDKKPGDWKCPQCKDLVFARNSSCLGGIDMDTIGGTLVTLIRLYIYK